MCQYTVLGVGDGQGGLACCDSWGRKESDMTEVTQQHRILKDVNNNPVCKTARDTDVQNSLLDSVGEGEGGMVWENGIETCIKSYMK